MIFISYRSSPFPYTTLFRSRGLFPYLPGQPGYNKRLRKLATTMYWLIRMLAMDTTRWADDEWVVDSTPGSSIWNATAVTPRAACSPRSCSVLGRWSGLCVSIAGLAARGLVGCGCGAVGNGGSP